MADDLYDRDFLAWTEAQAAALRARRAGENALDYDNLAEEIEDVGKREFRACQSYIELIIEHLLKMEFVGPSEALPGYQKELRAFRRNLGRDLTPTIETRLRPELDEMFSDVVGDLVAEGLVATREAVLAERPSYSWEQLRGADWYPERRDA